MKTIQILKVYLGLLLCVLWACQPIYAKNDSSTKSQTTEEKDKSNSKEKQEKIKDTSGAGKGGIKPPTPKPTQTPKESETMNWLLITVLIITVLNFGITLTLLYHYLLKDKLPKKHTPVAATDSPEGRQSQAEKSDKQELAKSKEQSEDIKKQEDDIEKKRVDDLSTNTARAENTAPTQSAPSSTTTQTPFFTAHKLPDGTIILLNSDEQSALFKLNITGYHAYVKINPNKQAQKRVIEFLDSSLDPYVTIDGKKTKNAQKIELLKDGKAVFEHRIWVLKAKPIVILE